MVCFDDRRVKGLRCDGHFNCLFGEDECLCDDPIPGIWTSVAHRERRKARATARLQNSRLPRYPADVNITELNSESISSVQFVRTLSSNLFSSSFFSPCWCNRGLGILSPTDSIACFCRPTDCGDRCQFHADRLSVLLHLTLSQSNDRWKSDWTVVLKLLILLFFDNERLMSEEFHLHTSVTRTTRTNFPTHLPHLHSLSFREQRRERFFNRSDLLLRQRDAIRIELDQTRRDEQPALLTIGKDPISRFARVLHWNSSLDHRDPCSTDPCSHPNEECHPLMNNRSQFLCLCNGRCLRGDPQRSKEFLCLCPSCHLGERCQFNTQSFVFTLAQLFSPDLFSTRQATTPSLLIFFSLLLFCLGLLNNLFFFVTIRRHRR